MMLANAELMDTQVAIRIFWALGIGLLAQSVAALFDGFSFLRNVRLSRCRPLNDFTPPVTVIIPCKGMETDFESNVSNYPHPGGKSYDWRASIQHHHARLQRRSLPGSCGRIRVEANLF